jgi:hypothetical protein
MRFSKRISIVVRPFLLALWAIAILSPSACAERRYPSDAFSAPKTPPKIHVQDFQFSPARGIPPDAAQWLAASLRAQLQEEDMLWHDPKTPRLDLTGYLRTYEARYIDAPASNELILDLHGELRAGARILASHTLKPRLASNVDWRRTLDEMAGQLLDELMARAFPQPQPPPSGAPQSGYPGAAGGYYEQGYGYYQPGYGYVYPGAGYYGDPNYGYGYYPYYYGGWQWRSHGHRDHDDNNHGGQGDHDHSNPGGPPRPVQPQTVFPGIPQAIPRSHPAAGTERPGEQTPAPGETSRERHNAEPAPPDASDNGAAPTPPTGRRTNAPIFEPPRSQGSRHERTPAAPVEPPPPAAPPAAAAPSDSGRNDNAPASREHRGAPAMTFEPPRSHEAPRERAPSAPVYAAPPPRPSPPPAVSAPPPRPAPAPVIAAPPPASAPSASPGSNASGGMGAAPSSSDRKHERH